MPAIIHSGASNDTLVTRTTAQTITGQKTFEPPAISTTPLVVRGLAGQTSSLLVVQNSALENLLTVGSTGTFTISGPASTFGSVTFPTTTDYGYMQLRNNVNPGVAGQISGRIYVHANNVAGTSTAVSELRSIFGTVTAGAEDGYWQFYTTIAGVNTATVSIGNASLAQMYIPASAAARKGLIIRAAATPTANIQEWQASNGVALSLVAPNGSLRIFGPANVQGVDTAAWLNVSINASGDKGAVVRAAASQTANLTEWQNSAGGILASVNAGGGLTSYSGTPLVFNGNGAGTFLQTVIYSDANSAFFIDLGRTTDVSTATPRNFVIQARGGGHPNSITVEPERTVMNGSLIVTNNQSFQGQNTRGLMVGNDLWIYDVNIGNAIGFSGVGNPEVGRLYMGRASNGAPFINGNDVNKSLELQPDGNSTTGGAVTTRGQFYVADVDFGANTNGRIRMGNTDTQYTLGLNAPTGGSSPGFFRAVSNGGGEKAYLRWDGQWFAVAYNGISAEATKDDIQTLSAAEETRGRTATKSLAQRFNEARAVSYKPKGGVAADKRMFSFVAEELSEVLPEATAYNDEGVPSGINLNAMISILTVMVQEQNKKIENLEQLLKGE